MRRLIASACMIRIHTADAVARWRFKCPECHSVDWRCHDGTLGCRNCSWIGTQLFDDKRGVLVDREEIEFVGKGAEKATFGTPLEND